VLSSLVLSAKRAEISTKPLTAAAGEREGNGDGDGGGNRFGHILVDLGVKRKTLFAMEDVNTDAVALLTELLSARLSHGGDVDDFMLGRW